MIDAVTYQQAEEIQMHWREEPPIGVVIRSYLRVEPSHSLRYGPPAARPAVTPREVTPEEMEQILAGERAFADRSGKVN